MGAGWPTEPGAAAGRLNPFQAAQYLHGPGHTGRLPSRYGFKLSENLVKADTQVRDHMVRIQGEAVPGMDGRRRSADPDGAWQDLLKTGC